MQANIDRDCSCVADQQRAAGLAAELDFKARSERESVPRARSAESPGGAVVEVVCVQPPRAPPAPAASIVPLHGSHHSEAALCLAAAFLEDPVLGRLLFRQDAYKCSGAALFFAHLLDTHYRGGAHSCYIAQGPRGGVQGVCLWQPPGAAQGLPLWAMLRMALVAPSIFGLSRTWRALRTGALVDEEHERQTYRHYYLAFLGVAPTYQGQGAGSALLAPVLKRADAEGVACYLENSNPANLPFYERAGFKTVKEIAVGSSSLGEPVMVYAMKREAR
jgi:ribosomal protein S18 acetylase RimI-like enzyme